MHPDVDDPVLERALRLRDLILVVGEFQVDPAGMQIEPFAAGSGPAPAGPSFYVCRVLRADRQLLSR